MSEAKTFDDAIALLRSGIEIYPTMIETADWWADWLEAKRDTPLSQIGMSEHWRTGSVYRNEWDNITIGSFNHIKAWCDYAGGTRCKHQLRCLTNHRCMFDLDSASAA
jgi:hypothetical protein